MVHFKISQLMNQKVNMWKWFRWVLLFMFLSLVISGTYVFNRMHLSFFPAIDDGDNPPQFIQANFFDLDKVYAISKFRSGVGHDFSVGSGETCRSMKHYFSSMDPNAPLYKRSEFKEGNWPSPTEDQDVDIYSPVDGKIIDLNYVEDKVGVEITIIADSQPNIRIRLMHITPLKDIKKGMRVKAGQKIGLVYANQSFDIGLENSTLIKTTYISYFAAMSDNVFTEYQDRGVKKQSDFIITRQYRDAHPLQCKKGTEEFLGDASGTAEDMVYLSGYDEVNTKLRAQFDEMK